MSATVHLPGGPLTLSGAGAQWATPGARFTGRVAYAAAHVVADPAAENVPGHSEALLGVLAAIAPPAAAALRALDDGDLAAYDRILDPTVPLARHLFRTPTWFYKTGIVFLAWLSGHQDHFIMAAGAQSGRSPGHLAELIRLADAAGLLPDAELAAYRARAFFTTAGVDQP